MPYVVIDNKPVYISWKLSAQLKDEFFGKDKVPFLMRRGSKEAKEFNKAQYTLLEKKYKKAPNSFENDYVKFNLLGDDAIGNVWDLLYDYCHYHGYAFLTEIRDFTSQLTDDLLGDSSYNSPFGKVFALDHFVKPYRWWWRFTGKVKGRTVRLIISVNDVTRIVGSLDDFILYTNNFVIRCNKEFQVSPIGID